MATTTVDPYKVLQESYNKRTEAINAQTALQEAERKKREQAAQETLTNANRGVYTTYKQQVNPYGSVASQNNFSQGVSDYYKNASYGTMLQGLGVNQYNYNDTMNNSNSLWQSYLAQKAGNEADALNDYNSAVLAQQKYDKEQEDAEKERQRAIEEFNLQLKLQQEQLARQKAQDEEDKRRWELEWARQQKLDEQAKNASSGSSSGGGGGNDVVFDNNGDPFTGWNEENGYAVEYKNGKPTGKKIRSNTSGGGANNTTKATNIVPTGGSGGSTTKGKITTKYAASGIKGKRYLITYRDGKEISRKVVNA